MLAENASLILSLICLAVAIINVIATMIKSCQKLHHTKIKLNKMEISFIQKETVTKRLLSMMDSNDLSAEFYLKALADHIKMIYPDSTTRISIKIVKQTNKNSLGESKVVTWASYPKDTVYADLALYTIKNNTDLNSIYVNNSEYFFVANLKEFSTFDNYINENQDAVKKWITSIVYPIKESRKDGIKDRPIGFLSISSPQEFSNIKKNELVIECIKIVSSKLYSLLQTERASQKYI